MRKADWANEDLFRYKGLEGGISGLRSPTQAKEVGVVVVIAIGPRFQLAY